MALLFFDGFDYSNLSSNRWNISAPSHSTAQIRTGTHSADGNIINVERDVGSNIATLILGFASYKSASGILCSFRDGGTAQLTISVLSDRSIEVRRGSSGGTLLGTSAASIYPLNAWAYVEVKAKIDPSTGTVEIRLGGSATPVLNLTGQNTRNTANSYTNRMALISSYFDDVYLSDTTGSAPNNDFLGDVKVEVLYPSGAGTYAEWTPSTGSNYQNVDEAGTPNNDTDYNSSATPNQRDLFAMGNLATTSGTVFGVQTHMVARKDDAGTRQVALMTKSGATETVGSTETLTTSYVNYDGTVMETDPNTAAAWTITNVNAIEAGYKEIA